MLHGEALLGVMVMVVSLHELWLLLLRNVHKPRRFIPSHEHLNELGSIASRIVHLPAIITIILISYSSSHAKYFSDREYWISVPVPYRNRY